MCFARALFRHRNFQKWSEPLVFLTFWLRNMLRATTACNFLSLIFPDVSAPTALASLLFNPPEPQNHEKNSVFRKFPTFSRTCIFFLLIFSLLTLLPVDCFFISPYCRKFDFQTSFDYWQWWWWWWNWRWSRRCRWGWRCNGTMAYAYTCSQTRAKHGPGGIEPGPW